MRPNSQIEPARGEPLPGAELSPPARSGFGADSAGWLAAGVGALILLGWTADLPVLRSFIPGQVDAKANTGLALVLAGTALGLRARRPVAGVGLVAGGLVGALGLATLAEYLLGLNLGIDQMLFPDEAVSVASAAGRMALPTAISLALTGAGLVSLARGWRRAAAVCGSAVALIALLGFAGSLYDAHLLMAFGPTKAMSAPTGLGLLALGTGLVAAGGLWGEERRLLTMSVGFGAALLLLGLLGGAVVRNTRQWVATNGQMLHAQEVLNRLSGSLSALQDVETASRGFLLTGDVGYLEPLQPGAEAAHRDLGELRLLLIDHPDSLARVERLAALAEQKIVAGWRQVELFQSGNPAAAREFVAAGEGKRLMDAIRHEVSALEQDERQRLARLEARMRTGTVRTLAGLALGLGLSVALLVAVFVFLRREINARTRLAAALQRSEESLAVTLRSIGDGVLATDTAGRVTLLNPLAEQLTGWSQAEARGRPVEEVFRIVHEETRRPAPMPVTEVLASGEPRLLANHTALIARDGTERAIADSAAPIRDDEGRLLGVVLVFRDVTESRRAQAQLDRFFELSLDFLCIASVDGYFKRASPAVTEILGWSVEEFLAMPYLEQIHPDDRESALREVARQAEGQRVLHYECRFRHKDGSWRVLAWRSSPHEGYMYASARDVTEARRAEAQIHSLNRVLKQHAAQLEVANRELESFSYSVSHDLRAPLRHVQGYVEMLTREAGGALSDKARRYLQTIADAAREMGVLIDDLLAFSRMGRTEMHETEVDAAALVAEVREALQPDAAGREVTWVVGPLPRVKGDAAMLRQVFMNLLGNALKYTRGRKPAVIEVGCAGREEGRAVFFVRDNGAGFDMRYADKLFGVFQRLHRAEEFEGTGIGLASVRRIVGRHGGRTWAEGRLNAGATFFLTLQPAGESEPAGPSSP